MISSESGFLLYYAISYVPMFFFCWGLLRFKIVPAENAGLVFLTSPIQFPMALLMVVCGGSMLGSCWLFSRLDKRMNKKPLPEPVDFPNKHEVFVTNWLGTNK